MTSLVSYSKENNLQKGVQETNQNFNFCLVFPSLTDQFQSLFQKFFCCFVVSLDTAGFSESDVCTWELLLGTRFQNLGIRLVKEEKNPNTHCFF